MISEICRAMRRFVGNIKGLSSLENEEAVLTGRERFLISSLQGEIVRFGNRWQKGPGIGHTGGARVFR